MIIYDQDRISIISIEITREVSQMMISSKSTRYTILKWKEFRKQISEFQTEEES